ncbi:11174_t:CDS:2, partial [Dentiscutata erythropus]
SELFDNAELRSGSLPHENVCTENLTPWIKLLPCKSRSGIASLLNGHKLYDSNFHSMSIHVRPLCEDPECLSQQLEILQTVSTVVDPVRVSGKRDSNYWCNISRFLNHSCDANLVTIPFFVEHKDIRFQRIAFFAQRDIPKNSEITVDYKIHDDDF